MAETVPGSCPSQPTCHVSDRWRHGLCLVPDLRGHHDHRHLHAGGNAMHLQMLPELLWQVSQLYILI